MELVVDNSSWRSVGAPKRKPARCCREYVLHTAGASLALQAFCLGFVAIFAPWSSWKATIATPLASYEYVRRGAVAVGAMGLVLYFFDFSPFSRSPGANACVKLVNQLFYAAIAFVGVLYVIAESQQYPAHIMALALLALPLLAIWLRSNVLAGRLASDVLKLVATNLAITSAYVAVGWGVWLFLEVEVAGADGSTVVVDNRWRHDNRIRWMARLGCGVAPACRQRAYILWAAGGILSLVCAFFSLVALLLARLTARSRRWEIARVGALAEVYTRRRESMVAVDPSESRAVALSVLALEAYRLRRSTVQLNTETVDAAKVVGACVAILVFGIYVAVSVGGAGMELTHAFVGFLVAALVGLALYVGSAIGFSQLIDTVAHNPTVTLVRESLHGELAFACAVFFGAPLFAIYLCVAFVNQRARDLRRCLCCGVEEEGGGRLFTGLAHRQLAWLHEHNWSSVLDRMQVIGLLTWMLLYGSTITYMGLAALVAWLRTVACSYATATYFVVGVTLFLLPPVPGLAVYLTAGVVIPPACEPELGFYGSAFLAAVLAFAMKLVAQIMQQKIIGEQLGQQISVRRTVGVNSDTIKAVREILRRPGFSVGKVSILCGGPDWPTAVLCGILRLSLCQMLLGLTPMVFFTVPAAFAGAFLLRQKSADTADDLSVPLANLFAMIATLQSLALGVLAFYHIQRTKETSVLCDNDAEVEELEAREEKTRATFAEVTQLARTPLVPKLANLSGTVVLVLSSYLLIFASPSCFEEFELTDNVAEALCLSCERAVVKPLGWCALGMLFYAIGCRQIWQAWADGAVKSSTAMV